MENTEAMDIVEQMLDEAENLADNAKEISYQILSDESYEKYGIVTYFMEFHRDEVEPKTEVKPFPVKDISALSFVEKVDDLQLKQFGSLWMVNWGNQFLFWIFLLIRNLQIN